MGCVPGLSLAGGVSYHEPTGSKTGSAGYIWRGTFKTRKEGADIEVELDGKSNGDCDVSFGFTVPLRNNWYCGAKAIAHEDDSALEAGGGAFVGRRKKAGPGYVHIRAGANGFESDDAEFNAQLSYELLPQ